MRMGIADTNKVEPTYLTLQANSMLEWGALKEPREEWRREESVGDTDNCNPGPASQKARSVVHEKAQQKLVAERGLALPYAKIAIKDNKRIFFISMMDILSIEAQGNYVLMHRRRESTMLREPISTVAGKLEAHGFVRVHRSILVNRLHVEYVEVLNSGEYQIVLCGDKRYTVSRSYKNNLLQLAATWIGSLGFHPQRS